MSTDKSTLDAAQTAFIRARITLMASNPFYAHLVMKMPLAWMENVPGGVSATDGTSLIINPNVYVKLSKQEQVSVLVHEVHIALQVTCFAGAVVMVCAGTSQETSTSPTSSKPTTWLPLPYPSNFLPNLATAVPSPP